MTCRIDRTGEGAPSGAPRPVSCVMAANAFMQSHPVGGVDDLALFAYEQRLVGAIQDHATFDGILAEHALALEEVRTDLAVALDAMRPFDLPRKQRAWRALDLLDDQIKYVRALGSVAAPQDMEGEPDAHED